MTHKLFKSSLIGLSVLAMASLPAVSMAAETVVGIPFAVIDLMLVNTRSLASLNANKSLKALQTTNLGKLKTLKADSTKKAQALRTKAAKSTPAETLKIRKQLKDISTNYNAKVSLYRKQIAYSQTIYNQELVKAIRTESNKLRIKYQLAAIFNAGTLLSVSSKLDLTKEALADLNKTVKVLKAPDLSKVK